MEDSPDKPKKKKFSLKRIFNYVFSGSNWREMKNASRQTLKDLRQLKEIFIFAAGVAIPGGLVGYAVYRIKKYRDLQKPANDNKEPPPPQPPENKPPSP